MRESYQVHFGGPERPRHLRDLLAERVRATPAGGYIHWVTYYFRDRRLARALIDAQRRGVKVTVCLAAQPRTAAANAAVIALLAGAPGSGKGLDGGLRLISLPGIPAPAGRAWRAQLHEKLYCFSHPTPTAFIGSFNPSGDVPEERPDIIREIGDQDRGHNVLVALSEPRLAAALREHAQQIYSPPPPPPPPRIGHRFTRRANQVLHSGHTRIHFWPRCRQQPLIALVGRLGQGAHLRLAASHLSARAAIKALCACAARGAKVEILAGASRRRVSENTEQRLRAAGISFRRIGSESETPMHLKFMLAEEGRQRWTAFGSANWTWPSLWLNYEIAAVSEEPALYAAFAAHWQALHRAP